MLNYWMKGAEGGNDLSGEQEAFLWLNSMLLRTFTGRVVNEAIRSTGDGATRRPTRRRDTNNGGFQEMAS